MSFGEAIWRKTKNYIRDMILLLFFHAMFITILIIQLESAFTTNIMDTSVVLATKISGHRVIDMIKCDVSDYLVVKADEC